MLNKTKLGAKFAAMQPKQRMLAAGGGLFVILAVAGIMMGPSQPAPVTKKPKGDQQTSFAMPGTGRDLTIEKLAAQVEASKQELDREKEKNNRDRKAAMEAASKPPQGTVETLAELQRMKAELEAVKQKQQEKPSLDDELPPPSKVEPINTAAALTTVLEQETPKLRVISTGTHQSPRVDENTELQKPLVFLPAGSNFEGILLNGMDAPTSSVTVKNPVPALMRIKTDAILPNRHRYDVRECFVIVSGFGVLSTERAQLQLVSLSCVKNDGAVIESKLEGYIVGEDGKVGLRGRLVTKQGQIIAKSLIAGFFSGFASSMAPSTVPQLNVNPGGSAQYQMPSLSNAAAAGAAQGVSSSAQAISQFYLDMAKEMFPVVEVDAARRATIVLIKGVELNMNGGKE